MNRNSQQLKPQKRPLASPPLSLEGDDQLRRFIWVSSALHVVLLALFTLRAVFYPNEPLQLERAIRVDMVGLPEKHAELPPALKEEAKAKPLPTKLEPPTEQKPDKVVIPDQNKPLPHQLANQLKDKQKAALDRLKAMSKIESMMKEKEAQQAAAKTASSAPIKGNEVSPGSALTGMARIENEKYLEELDEHVKKHWHVPNFLANAQLSAAIRIYVDGNGIILKREMLRSSGNQIFDQTVMECLDNASPLPVPPRRLANLFMVDGLTLGFPD